MTASRIEPRVYYEFICAADARTYRHEHGTGGWIFEDEKTGQAWIFPPAMPPTGILHHPITRGRSGRLIGSG